MHSLTPAQVELLRHNLNTVCRLLEPAPKAREAFRQGLLSLLLQTGAWQDEDEADSYLAGILRNTCLAPGYERPRQLSSPVCYAQTPGLRPGFEEEAMPDQLKAPWPAEAAPMPDEYPVGGSRWQELFSATQSNIRHILGDQQGNRVADPVLEKQIADLVSRLFGQPAGSN